MLARVLQSRQTTRGDGRAFGSRYMLQGTAEVVSGWTTGSPGSCIGFRRLDVDLDDDGDADAGDAGDADDAD